MKPSTLEELKRLRPGWPIRSVKEEMRSNLLEKLRSGEKLFPGIIGFEDTVIPGIVNALLARHNLILLGLRGQAKSRILRGLATFLDPEVPFISGCEIHDDPFSPICATCHRRLQEEGESLPIEWLSREDRYVEKLATPDVTIADIIGDIDPIRAARQGRDLAQLENMHFGLLPRAHRGIFAINELPDLAPKIQVGLLNIMQEGDVQIKGFPIRLPLDVLLVFTANPEDYTARGKIITPLKDRIGAEIRTHYPDELDVGIRITQCESWIDRGQNYPVEVPQYIYEIIEHIAFQGRLDNRIDRRSGVSQRLPITCLECSISNAERRAVGQGEKKVVLRVSDIYASFPAITGKIELEYEGELKGARKIAQELVQSSVLKAFSRRFPNQDFDRIVEWFNLGGEIKVTDQTPAIEYYEKVRHIQGLTELFEQAGADPEEDLETSISLIEFVLEGLYAQKRLSRNEERGFFRESRKLEEEFFGDVGGERRSFN